MLQYIAIIVLFLSSITNAEEPPKLTLEAKLPEGFVYLHNIDYTIAISIRYGTEDNFIGRPINGYKRPVAILTAEAASALQNAQREFKNMGYSLVVYAAYSPQKTHRYIIDWASDSSDQTNKELFYPNIEKSQILELGYIEPQFPYARGSTVAVSIIPVGEDLRSPNEIKRDFYDGTEIIFLNDGTVDMGSSFDLFDPISHHNCSTVALEAEQNRRFLKETMIKHGFIPYEKVWWRYTLEDEPFADTEFDFDVE